MNPFPGHAPHLFTLPPGVDFARLFAAGFQARIGPLGPIAIAQTTVLVNTTRAMRTIEDALADLGPGPLPQMALMADLHADPLAAPDLAPSLSPLRRTLRLTRLVESFLEAKSRAGEAMAPLSAAPDLAHSLALLIDQFHDEGVPAAFLETAFDADLGADAARHWQETLSFLDIVRKHWPRIRAETEHGALDPRARQRGVIEAMIAEWQGTPPPGPVIAAASTGSVGSTAQLLAAVARLPEGAVVLPGFDPATDPGIWQSAGAEHPLGPFRGLLDELGAMPSDAELWTAIPDAPRRRLIEQAMRPAPVTDHWPKAAPDLRREIGDATSGLTLIEAETPRHESLAIATAMRETIETPGRTVTLVTPDAALARRVGAMLATFGIVPDDTMGQPLGQSPPAIYLRLMLDAALDRSGAVGLAALLQHPLSRPGIDRARHLDLARGYERAVLRTRRSAPDPLPDWPKGPEDAAHWLETIRGALASLHDAIGAKLPLDQIVATHRNAAEALTDPGDGSGPVIWSEEAGETLAGFLDRLTRDADAFGEQAVPDYPALLMRLMQGEQIRPRPRQPHPRVAICGPREARLEAADRIILAGLNEGSWPEIPDPGPWLSRPMRDGLGLAPPERSVGLSAHDFLNAACQPEVILSRSKKVGGAATVASRWLIRLETLINGIGEQAAWQAMTDRGTRYLALSDLLSQPDAPMNRAERPRPVPPPQARPRELPVTAVETLVRDAYAVYARYVLRLRPLDPLGEQPDARERGTVLHKVLEEFVTRTPDWPGPEQAHTILMASADDVLAREAHRPDLRRIWRARIARLARWFLETEDARRAGSTPIKTEADGKLIIALPNGPMALSARADRIDRLADGTAAIYDYKSSPPTKDQVKAGFNPQIHILAAVLEAGGFDGLPAMASSQGAYIGLGGSASSAGETPVDDLAATLKDRMDQLGQLLGAHDTGTPYVSHGRSMKTRYAGDYDHLARLGEWFGEEKE